MKFKTVLKNNFLRYVQIDTTANEESKSCPSSEGQLTLGRLLMSELKELGIPSEQDQNGYVYAKWTGNVKDKPCIGLLAHLDTSPEVPGKDVKPQVHASYNGEDILISDKIILSPKDFPELLKHRGHDIITASGGTLLGADNKAGIAIIMTFLKHIQQHPELPCCGLVVAFTPDEEIGRGMDHFDVSKFRAKYAYTVDGDLLGSIENETFNANGLTIKITGKSVHPGSAKNKMANATWIASDIISSWPESKLPETTQDYEGFIGFLSLESSVEFAQIRGIVRHHDLSELNKMEDLLQAIVAQKRLKFPLAKIEVEFKEQYRNMKEKIQEHPLVLSNLEKALQQVNIIPNLKPVRGGTDGARLSFMGIPTPNIFVGGSNFHGQYEWVSLDSMEKSVEVLLALTREFTK